MSRSLRLTCLLVALLSMAACKEDGQGVAVKSLKFVGVRAVAKSQVEAVLVTAPSAKLPWGVKNYFNREQFEADLKRIQAFYADRGFPDARVESFDVKLSPDQTSVEITVRIVEGEPVRVERITLEGFDPLPDDRERAIKGELPLREGTPLDRALLQASRETALDELKDRGYPYASVGIEEEPGSSPPQRVVVLRAEPGPLAYFGPIEITGNTSVNDSVVRRQLWFRPGQVFQQTRLRDSQRRLYALELFQFVNVQPVGLEDRSPVVPTRVTVTEGKHRKVNLDVGYGSEERARAEIDWRHVNFFGGARTAGVLARYSSLDRGVRLNLNQPYVFSPRYSLGLSAQMWHSDEPAFVLDTQGGRVTIGRQFRPGGGTARRRRPATTIAATYINEWEDYTISNEALNDPTFRDELIALGLDPRTGTGSGRLSALSVDIGRNTTENLLDATRGYFATLHVENAGQLWRGSYDYNEVTAEGRLYQTVGRRVVLAVRARAGAIDSSGDENVLVPFFKRYFLGGSTTLRGWGRYEVSPLSGSGLPIGGTSLFNFSTEVRVPISGNIAAVLFLDGGNVWEEPWDFDFSDMRYDVGPGLRYNTPVGPLRLDFGYQLNPIPGLLVNGAEETRRFRIHFSIGQSF